MPELNPDDFDGRYALCPVCRRDNVPLRRHEGRVVFDEHPVAMVVGAHPAPIDPGARYNPRKRETTWARVRCPLSLAPLMPLEET